MNKFIYKIRRHYDKKIMNSHQKVKLEIHRALDSKSNNEISSNLIYDLKKYCPIEIDDIIRIGPNSDGGYIISEMQLNKTSILLSFGINDDWRFEENFKNIKNDIHIFGFDKSSVKTVYANLLAKKFCNFFDGKEKYFFPFFLNSFDNDDNICFDTIFNTIPKYNVSLKPNSIFVKMDIEGCEYFTLPYLVPYFKYVNGLVVEFHNLNIANKNFEYIMNLIMEEFYIAHVHANNCGNLILNTNLPDTLEITFINKTLISGTATSSNKKYPILNLDYPCNLHKEDYILNFD